MPSKKSIFATIVLAALAVGYVTERVSWSETTPKATAPATPPVFRMPVPVAEVVKKTIPIVLEYSARVESIRNVKLQAKVTGYVQEQAGIDGADVHAGDLLYQIDPRDYQAALDQVTAQVERDSAALDYTRTTLDRGADLVKTGAVTKDAYEQRTSANRQADAALRADQAALRAANLNLKRTEIRAPFSGRLGRNEAPVGTLISSSGATLNTLVQLDPIYVAFNPSETDLVDIQKARQTGRLATDVVLAGSTDAAHPGELTFIDNAVDRATGTIALRATVANSDFSLLPGQYVRVRVHLREQPNTLMVPQAAIGSGQFGKYVYVVGEGDKAEIRPVTLGTIDGDQIAVLTGVRESDRIVTGNLQKIGPGSPLQPLPAAKPAT